MKRKLFLYTFLFPLLCFLGCSSSGVLTKNTRTISELVNEVKSRFAFVRASDSTRVSSSSAISIGDGFFLTTYHSLIRDEDSVMLPFYVQKGARRDTGPRFIRRENDMAIFWSSLGIGDSVITPRYDIGIGEQTAWIQPMFYAKGVVNIFFHIERISRIDSLRIFIDRPVFPGTSGSGLFDTNGNLIGIIDQFYFPYHDQVTYGSALKIGLLETILEKGAQK